MDDAAWLQARLGPLVGLREGEAADRDESFAAWQGFIEAIATTAPLILLFEDLHWADPALLEFVERLVDWSNDVPILVVCTARPELYERHSGWGGGLRNATTLALSPLSSDETARLVAGLLDTAVLPAETQTALLERAGGNPLYAEEYVRLFLEVGSTQDLPLPDTVQGIIAARLDTLPPDRKSLLQDAAVIGKVFWAGALEAMGGRSADEVSEGLHQLARKELLRPARLSSVEGQTEYLFWHALIRDVAYGQIPRTARAAKHEAAADWLEEMAGDRLLDHADLLAHHVSQALELAKAAGADPNPELERRAGRFLALAGERAMELDITAAHGLFARALELVPAGTEEHGLVLIRAADASTALARFEESRVLYDEAALELEAAGSTANAVRAYGMLGVAYFQIGGADGMRAALEHALELLEGLPPGPEHVDIYGRMVALEMLSGQPPQVGLVWAEKAIALGEPLGLRRELIRPYQWRGIMRCELGDLGGLEDLEHALSEALTLPVPSMVVPSHVNLGDQIWRQRGPAAGLEILAAGIASRSARVGGKPTWPQAESCWMLHDLGEWDELLRVAEEVRQVEAEHGPAQPGAMSQTYAALVLIRRGAVDEAAMLAADVLARARAMEEPQVLAPCLVVSAARRGGARKQRRSPDARRGVPPPDSQPPVFPGAEPHRRGARCLRRAVTSLSPRASSTMSSRPPSGTGSRRSPPVPRSPRHAVRPTRRQHTRKPPRAGRRSAASSSRRSPFAAPERKPPRRRSSRSSACRCRRLRRPRGRRSSSPAAARARAATRRAAPAGRDGRRASAPRRGHAGRRPTRRRRRVRRR